ncbi:MAG: GTP-binding protein [Candidatus Micrarchaeaceae archaeon]
MRNLYIIGGFLGSGKTTMISKFTQRLLKRGKRVGVIVNDFSTPLVDERYLTQIGAQIEQVSGKCVCHTTAAVNEALDKMKDKDEIFLEPIGTHLDVASAILPEIILHTADLIVKPVVILVDGKKLNEILKKERWYILEFIFQQLQSEDIIFVNKADIMNKDEIEEITKFFEEKKAQFILGSAFNDMNTDELVELLEGRSNWSEKKFEKDDQALFIHYETYVKMQERMKWVNLYFTISADHTLITDKIVRILKGSLKDNSYLGHLKMMLISKEGYVKFNLTRWDEEPQIIGVYFDKREWKVIVNMRIEADGDLIEKALEALFYNLSSYKVNIINKEVIIPLLKWGKFVRQN